MPFVINLLPVCLNSELKYHQCLKIHSYSSPVSVKGLISVIMKGLHQCLCGNIANLCIQLVWYCYIILIKIEAIGIIQKHIHVLCGLNILLLYIIFWWKRNQNSYIYYACNWTWNCNVGLKHNIVIYKPMVWYTQI